MPDLARGPLLVAHRTRCYACDSPVAVMTANEYQRECRRLGGPRLVLALHLCWLWRCTSCSQMGASLAL